MRWINMKETFPKGYRRKKIVALREKAKRNNNQIEQLATPLKLSARSRSANWIVIQF
jgi:hypothetical protein